MTGGGSICQSGEAESCAATLALHRYGSAEPPNSSFSWSGVGFPYLMLLARRSPAISESWISGRNLFRPCDSFRPCEDLQMSRLRLAYVAIRPVVVAVGAAAGKSRWCAGCAQEESSKGSSHHRLVSGERAGNWVDAAARQGDPPENCLSSTPGPDSSRTSPPPLVLSDLPNYVAMVCPCSPEAAMEGKQ